MIEAFISGRKHTDGTDKVVKLKKRGDIIAVKLRGAYWGEQQDRGAVFIHTDDNLQAQLEAQKAARKLEPVIIEPYAEYEVKNDQRIMVNRSRLYVDIEDLSARNREQVYSRSNSGDLIPEGEITTKLRERETISGVDDTPNAPPATRTRTR